MNTTATVITASEKQVLFIVKLMAERDYSGLNVTNVEDRVQNGPLSKTDASTLISLMLGCPKKATAKVEVAEGFYYFEGDIYRVVKSKSSDRRYAKVMVIPEDGSKGRWEYAPNKISALVGAEMLDMQVATTLGRETGICMICGAFLTDPESIERGIGPICAAKL